MTELNFATSLRAQLQSANLSSLFGAISGLSISAAALRLGINEVLVRKYILECGIRNPDSILSEEEIERIRDWVKTRAIDTAISIHVLKEKHGWTEKCGADCILYVANNLKIYKEWFAEGGIPVVRGTGNCRHGCLIEVRMSIPPNQINWSIGTAFHIGDCKAK